MTGDRKNLLTIEFLPVQQNPDGSIDVTVNAPIPLADLRKFMDEIGVESIQDVIPRVREILRAGQLCSNVCYNLAQRDQLTEDERQSCRESYRAWDDAKRKRPEETT